MIKKYREIIVHANNEQPFLPIFSCSINQESSEWLNSQYPGLLSWLIPLKRRQLRTITHGPQAWLNDHVGFERTGAGLDGLVDTWDSYTPTVCILEIMSLANCWTYLLSLMTRGYTQLRGFAIRAVGIYFWRAI